MKGIIVVTAIVGAIALAAAVGGYYYSSNSGSNGETTAVSSDGVGTAPPKSAFYIWVNSTGIWRGLVQGSDFPQQTVQGSGNKFIETACSPGGTYTAVLRLNDEDKGQDLTVTSVWITLPDKDVMTPEQWDKITHAYGVQKPVVLKNETASTDSGMVTISGTC
jgi:hypothetical protein